MWTVFPTGSTTARDIQIRIVRVVAISMLLFTAAKIVPMMCRSFHCYIQQLCDPSACVNPSQLRIVLVAVASTIPRTVQLCSATEPLMQVGKVFQELNIVVKAQ